MKNTQKKTLSPPGKILNDPTAKRVYNRELFGIVSKSYDRATPWLSFFRDKSWKKTLLKMLSVNNPKVAIDIACGTGDITRLLHKKWPNIGVYGTDLTPEMIFLAPPQNNTCYAVADMQRMPIKDGCASVVCGGYALRNAPDLQLALREVYRILENGGCGGFLDFSHSSNRLVAFVQFVLLKIWGGLFGLLLHGNAAVYGYLADSHKCFPSCNSLRFMFAKEGLPIENERRCMFGLLRLWIVRKVA